MIVLTGPQHLTHEEMDAVIGDVLGRPVRFAATRAAAGFQS
jgi:uncharacterized protein YbjT (DUF2867 family)